MNYTFFIDESGNTGTNWLDSKQPFFSHGGWLVANKDIDNINSFLNKFISKQQCKELKSSNIFKRKNGLEIFFAIYEHLISNFDIIPIFSVHDKKYMISTEIVETFFDNLNNPYINPFSTFSANLRKALADFIYENNKNNNTLDLFSEFLSNGSTTVDVLRNISANLSQSFKSHGHFNVSYTLDNLSEENYLDMIK